MENGCIVAAALLLAVASMPAQQSRPAGLPPARDPNGAATRATHRPQAVLAPLLAWQYVKQGNARYVAARAQARDGKAAGDPGPEQHAPPRPTFAGRYVCAVFTCSDCALDIAAVLGMPREDVLVIQTPGPFVHAESVALVERMVRDERLSLVLVLGHAPCAVLAPPPAGRAPDALARRVAALRERTPDERPAVALAHRQRGLLLGASRLLADQRAEDRLRILPGLLDDATGTITWHVRNGDRLAIPPVDARAARR